ncbi:MAG: DNA phosphorothioation system sulfurtransferase DndC [Gammaproteobacteria bacterium]|nr:DNA phosphorothioation system sulfurtransferase DndC [Gammaproteobacteria bacterium]
MTSKHNSNLPCSYFDACGDFDEGVAAIVQEVVDAYLADDIPWTVGYSGGKDSTATLQLVWLALQRIGTQRAQKPVHVISTDTLVENPIVAAWVGNSLKKMQTAAEAQGLPITSHRLTPELSDSFWVNLIGRGYAAPRQKFRWCTERLKIRPAHRFISSVVDKYGETLLVLGSRKTESAVRARTMERHERGRVREKISPNANLSNSFIYTPIEDWANDDVWLFLLEKPNPWGQDNMDLFHMYKGATEGGECPLVVSSGTPSCGDSRFGCWVCTLVEKDKSMQAMIHNDEEKQWMTPLLEIRAEIDFRAMPEGGDRHLRDYRRMNGQVQLFHGQPIPGPYKQEFREHLLQRVLETQSLVRRTGPGYVRNLSLIRLDEMEEIRRIWVIEKHEMEDSLPRIYKDATGEEYPGRKLNNGAVFGTQEMHLLRELCGGDQNQYEMVRELLAIGCRRKAVMRRRGVFKSLQSAIERNFFSDEEDAVERARERQQLLVETTKKSDIDTHTNDP